MTSKGGSRSGGGSRGGAGTGKGGKSGPKRSGSSKGSVTDRRLPTVRVKTARKRKLSSTLWLQRQLNDPYVAEAKRLGYRSRAAFKLIEIDDKYKILHPKGRIVDLGCAPGGWMQVAVERVGEKGHVVGIDIQEVEPIAGAIILLGDFMDDDAPDRLKDVMQGQADAVISDMAAPASGHPQTDHLRIIGLAEAAYHFARSVLAPDGAFIAKVFSGGSEKQLLDQLKQDFRKVAHFKPNSSRKDSAEMYVIALGFRANAESDEESS